jgi:hypothetical protein
MKLTPLIIAAFLLAQLPIQPITALPIPPAAQGTGTEDTLPAPEIVKQAAQAITVRVSALNNGGSGAIIGRKGNQ